MKDYSYVFNAHPSYIDQLYQSFKQNPASIEDGWRVFFEGFEFGTNGHAVSDASGVESVSGISEKEFRVMALIQGYRS